MDVLEAALVQLAVPALVLIVLLRERAVSRLDAIASFATATSLFAFLWWAGRWHLLSVWLRFALPVALVWFGVRLWRKSVNATTYSAAAPWGWLGRATKIALVLFFAVRLSAVFQGWRYEGDTIGLQFPLGAGTYYVGQGGSTAAVNYHVVNRTQRYALDIVRLSRWGNRATRLVPRALSDYASFGASVGAPCTGTVQHVEANLPDNELSGGRDRLNPAGNHVALRCAGSDIDVLMAHFKGGSVRVHPGQKVVAGEALAAVGNSGNSPTPHLHIHAKRGGSPQSPTEGEGLPMTFAGKFLVRNALIRD